MMLLLKAPKFAEIMPAVVLARQSFRHPDVKENKLSLSRYSASVWDQSIFHVFPKSLGDIRMSELGPEKPSARVVTVTTTTHAGL